MTQSTTDTTYKRSGVVTLDMATCPNCESDITEWAERLERGGAASKPKVWTCPNCDAVLGITDWGAS